MFEGSLQKLYISLALIYVIPDNLNSRLLWINKNDHIHLFKKKTKKKQTFFVLSRFVIKYFIHPSNFGRKIDSAKLAIK